MADVQKILDTRNSQLSPNDSLFEGIDIFDSGVRSLDTTNPEMPPIDVPNVDFQTDPETGKIQIDPITGEPIPIYNTAEDTNTNN